MHLKKKLLAAVLAAAMLSTQAFETTAWAAESGQEIALADMTDEEVLEAALSEIHIPQTVTGNLTLQKESENGAAFQWTSSNESVISTKAVPCAVYYNEVDTPAGVVTRQAQDTSVTLTLKASFGSAQKTETYRVTVKAKKPREEYVGYLYAHFNEHAGTTYDGIQQIFFGISKNGVDWTALNNNQYVLESNVGDYGVRDPYIIRSAEGDRFYLIATDLDIDSYKYAKGNDRDWGLMSTKGSQGLVIWESDDLVSWSEPRLVDVASEINAGMAWAPEAIYDETTGEYLVFWSSGRPNGNYNYVYVAKTRDFWTFTEPELYSNAANPNDGSNSGNIDASIYKEGNTYYRLIKDEKNNSIRLQSAKKLLAYGEDVTEADEVTITKDGLVKMVNRGALFQKIDNSGTIDVTDASGNTVTKPCLEKYILSYEGPTMFKFNDRDEWCIMVDEYGRNKDSAAGTGSARGYIPFVTQNLGQPNSVYLPSDDEFVMPDAAKHGTIIPITQSEYDALMEKWGTPKQEGNKTVSNSVVLNYDFETVDGTTVTDVSTAGAENNGTLTGDAAVVDADGRGKVLQLNGFGSLTFPTGFFDGLSHMTLLMDVYMESDSATAFSMGSTVTNNNYGMLTVSSDNNQDLKGNWKQVAVVMDEHVMSIYINNELVAKNEHVRSVEELGSGLTAVLGAAYDGKSGFKGYIDNVKVYNRTVEDLTDPEVPNQRQAETVIALIQAIGNVGYNAQSKDKIEEARKAYEALTDVQKTLVTNFSALTKAETDYKKAEEAAKKIVKIGNTSIAGIANQNYTGKAIQPNLKVTYGAKTLKKGTDYTVSYSNNKNIGKATVTIKGIGSYTGTTTKSFNITVAKGKTYQSGSYKYKMTNANTSGKGTVTVTGVSSKNIKTIKVSDTVTIGGKKFKVTAIGDKAFSGCKKATSAAIGKNVKTIGKKSFLNCAKLKKITVNATALTKVGNQALKGIHKKAVIKVPAKKLSKYKKVFKGKGQGTQVKIQK